MLIDLHVQHDEARLVRRATEATRHIEIFPMPEVLAMQCRVAVDKVSERIRVVIVEPRRYAECISRQDERLSEGGWQYVTSFSVRASRSSSVMRGFEQVGAR